MISEHAMLVLMLLLAVAVVLLAMALMLYTQKLEGRLKDIAERMDGYDMKLSGADPIE